MVLAADRLGQPLAADEVVEVLLDLDQAERAGGLPGGQGPDQPAAVAPARRQDDVAGPGRGQAELLAAEAGVAVVAVERLGDEDVQADDLRPLVVEEGDDLGQLGAGGGHRLGQAASESSSRPTIRTLVEVARAPR